MLRKIFLDTNILLEVILNRKSKECCQKILQAGIEGDIDNYASLLSFANIAYILQKEKLPRHEIYSIERDLESIVGVLSMDGSQLHSSLHQEVKDFEDMLQYQCAISNSCFCIVTINTRHFRPFCEIPLFSPEEMLELLEAGNL